MTHWDKQKLDGILKEFKAQPVGNGYIDIIVSRDNYRSFVKALIENGFLIEAISWWEYIDNIEHPNTYGMGGPKSRFYSGWFAESCADTDELSSSNCSLSSIVQLIESKVLGEFNGQLVSFKATKSLTPAFWLKVDKGWENEYAARRN